MHTDDFAGRKTEAKGKLRMFSLYADYPASAHAKWVAGAITRLAEPRWWCYSEMWNLVAVTTIEPVKQMIAEAARDADVLIIAISSLDQREPKLMEWLDLQAARKADHRVPGLLVGLLGAEEGGSRELEWTVQRLSDCGRVMGRELVMRWMEHRAMADPSWLTPKVEALLSRKQFGCNEAIQREAASGNSSNSDAARLVAAK